MDGYLPVKVMVPLADYRRLHAQATARGTTVAEIIASRIADGRRKNPGRRTDYTPAAGAEITESRRLGKSWNEIGKGLGISHKTAQYWWAKYQREVREQNMRDHAERRAS